jgi:hypothetical protein
LNTKLGLVDLHSLLLLLLLLLLLVQVMLQQLLLQLHCTPTLQIGLQSSTGPSTVPLALLHQDSTHAAATCNSQKQAHIAKHTNSR